MNAAELTFEYAIRFPDGTYYNGHNVTPADLTANRGPRHMAYTFTERGAHNKIANCPILFCGCKVERAL